MIFFGNQAIVVAIDIAYSPTKQTWEVFIYEGTHPHCNAISWAKEMQKRGAREILLTSIDQDGTRNGFDLPLLHAVNQKVTTPAIAPGGVDNTNT